MEKSPRMWELSHCGLYIQRCERGERKFTWNT